MDILNQLPLFFLGVSSLFPLINPIGTALIINPYFSGATFAERRAYSLTICLSCFALGVATLFTGSWCLKFMGVSIATTQMAGGLIIARLGLALLNSEPQAATGAAPQSNIHNALFYPLAFPLTLGPGGISALITLSAHAHTNDLSDTMVRMGVLAGSLFAVMVLTYFCFSYSEIIIRRVGSVGSLVINRLMAFLVFCVGIQLLVAGLTHSFPHLFQ